MSQTAPDNPPAQEEPTHDVPVYPEQDPPPGSESAMKAAQGGAPGEGGEDDVDDDDLDPQAPHSPPDVDKSRVVFDEDAVPG
jgi:hypothetical protein